MNNIYFKHVTIMKQPVWNSAAKTSLSVNTLDACDASLIHFIEPHFDHLCQADLCNGFILVFCTRLKGNAYGTKYRLSGDKSTGLVKLAK